MIARHAGVAPNNGMQRTALRAAAEPERSTDIGSRTIARPEMTRHVMTVGDTEES